LPSAQTLKKIEIMAELKTTLKEKKNTSIRFWTRKECNITCNEAHANGFRIEKKDEGWAIVWDGDVEVVSFMQHSGGAVVDAFNAIKKSEDDMFIVRINLDYFEG